MRTQRVVAGLTVLNSLLLATIVAVALGPSGFAAAAIPPQASGPASRELPILRGRALEIVDEHGRIRARLNVESDGEVILRMVGRNGAIRVKLGGGDAGSGLLLADETTEPGVHIVARRTGTEARPTTTRLTLRAGGQEQVIRP
jgi:hypothetical protein